MAKLQDRAEKLLGRPVWTHELADPETWLSLRIALEMPGYRERSVTDPITSLAKLRGAV